MANVTTNIHAVGAPETGFFETIFNALLRLAEANSRSQEVERLQGMSDEQLAAKNIRREDIVRHVFRDVLYI